MPDLGLVGGALIFQNPDATGLGSKLLDEDILEHAGHLSHLRGGRQDFGHMLEHGHLVGATPKTGAQFDELLSLMGDLALGMDQFGQPFLALPSGVALSPKGNASALGARGPLGRLAPPACRGWKGPGVGNPV